MTTAISIIGGGDKANRKERDFYPTPPDVTHALMRFLAEYALIPSRVWECAAGHGDMARVIAEYTAEISTDITTGHDFMTARLPSGIDAIITNPPFNLAERFIRRAMVHEVPLVAMLLKSTYWHASGRLKLFTSHRPRYILPLTWRPDFDGRGSPTMDLQWTVWSAGDVTEYIPLKRPNFAPYTLPMFEAVNRER